MSRMEVKEQLEERENEQEIDEISDIQFPPFPTHEDLAKIAESHEISIITITEMANKQTYVMYLELQQAFGAKAARTISRLCQRKNGRLINFILPKGVYPALHLSFHQFSKILHIRGSLKNDSKYIKLKKAHEYKISNPTFTMWDNLKCSDMTTISEYLKSLIDSLADNPLALATNISELNTLAATELNQLTNKELQQANDLSKLISTLEKLESKIKQLMTEKNKIELRIDQLIAKKKETVNKITNLSQRLSTIREQKQKHQQIANTLALIQNKMSTG